MSDLDIRALRDRVDAAVAIPEFDEILARGVRRRRSRTGLALAALVLIGGGALALDHRFDNEGARPVDGVPTPKTPEQIIDDPTSDYDSAIRFENGREYAAWLDECEQSPCPVAVAWSDDGWETRTSELVPADSDYLVVDAGLIVMPWTGTSYIVDPDGATVPIQRPGPPAPLGKGEIILEPAVSRTFWLYVDPRTGQSHRVLPPPRMSSYQLTEFATGELRAIGHAPDESWMIAKSFDGGRTWSAKVIGIPLGTGGFGQDETHINIVDSGTTRFVSSSDAGVTWSRPMNLPFPIIDCATSVSGASLLISQGQLWTTSDDTWTHFERVPGAPELACMDSHGDVVTATGADLKTVYVSTDAGRTWTETDPG